MTSGTNDGGRSAALTDYIAGQLRELGEADRVEPDDDLIMIGFDSIAYLRLLEFIRERFGLEVPDTDVTVDNFGTVKDIDSYLQRLADSPAGDEKEAS